MTISESKSKPEVELQHGGSFTQSGSSNISAVDWDNLTKFGVQRDIDILKRTAAKKYICIYFGTPHFRTRGRPKTTRTDNIKSWTALSLTELEGMLTTEKYSLWCGHFAKANQPDIALYSSVWQTSAALRTCCQVRRGWTIREHCAQLFHGYRVTGGVLPADPDSHGREQLRKIWVHSASVCTRHGDEFRIMNNGKEPWKRLCSIMGPALDDDGGDDDDAANYPRSEDG